MNKKTCDKCHCNCHCENELHLHSDNQDLCTCDTCTCKNRAEDGSFENNGGVVVDDTGECESCQ